MAVPPSYCDLGKSAKDIFSKGYGFGVVKLDLKTKSQSGVEFSTSGSSNTDSGKATGSLETKYKMKELGLTFNQKWNTDNTLSTGVTLEDQLANGLKLTFDTTFVPNTGKKSGKLKTGYKRDYINLGCDVDFDFAGPVIHGAAVVGYEGWLAGYQVAFDTAKSKLAQNNFALGYKAGDFQLHTSVRRADTVEALRSPPPPSPLPPPGSRSLYEEALLGNLLVLNVFLYLRSLQAKVNNASLIGVGYTQTLRPGVKLTLSGLVDGKNFNAGGHKIGLGFELEA
ncbi:voltage-dependent anion-selective channel protein 2-like [Polyodon spathula]|uniref:voltage-dependent anion-selective channel protein 2-like n=1 Tax=Polyodon spathula TaxID=7913 RepID=UPI001B7E8C7F|nr:voltage-dependent anion-selective channel protein 2-like [Polyodon spathula]